MKPSPKNKSRQRTGEGPLGFILPFESTAIRLFLPLFLGLSITAAAWAYTYRVPETKMALAMNGNLLDLEVQLKEATEEIPTSLLVDLRQQRIDARKAVFPSESEFEQSFTKLIEEMRAKGWEIMLAGVSNVPKSDNGFKRTNYQFEFQKRSLIATATSEPLTEIEIADRNVNASAELLEFLTKIASRPEKIDIDRFRIATDGSRLAKTEITLSAAIAE